MVSNYKEIASQFCKYYYGKLDLSLPDIKPLYKDGALITFNGDEFLGVENYFNRLKASFNSISAKHIPLIINSQPVGANNILISVYVERFCNFTKTCFYETFLLEAMNGTFYIINNIVCNV